ADSDRRARLALRGESDRGVPQPRESPEARGPVNRAMRRAAVGLGVVLVAAGVWHLRAPQPGRPVAFAQRGESAREMVVAPDVARRVPVPAALRDTSPDGALATDDTAHLVVSLELRQFFDYFLLASGEESRARVRARIVD